MSKLNAVDPVALPRSFKNASGRRYLQGLFFETTLADKSSVLYTLKEQDHEVVVTDQVTGLRETRTYPSLYRLYMECNDVTEYSFAVQHLDGWSHWQELLACKWFLPFAEAWRDELRTRQEAEYRANIRATAADPKHPSAFMANKYLLEELRKPAEAKKRGRPSKGSGDPEKTHERALQAEIQQDAKRLGIN